MTDVTITIHTIDKTQKGIKSSQSALGELDKTVAKLTAGFVSMGVTVKKVFDWGEQGAQVIQTTDSFGLFLDKVHGAPDLLEQLRTASRGTIDDMRLMSATMTLAAGAEEELATELINTTPLLLEIAKAANKLNPALGDTAFMYQSIATGVKRASPLILDNLGLTIKVGEANEKYAQSMGKTTEELTATEQKMALLNATLEAGRILIEQAGGTTESATDNIARMEAALKNASNTIKSNFAPMIADAADAVFLLLTATEQIESVLIQHNQEIATATITYEGYVNEMSRAAKVAGLYAITQEELDGRMLSGAMAARAQAETFIILSEAQWQARASAKDLDAQMRGLTAIEIARFTDEVTTSTQALTEANRELTLSLSEVTAASLAKEAMDKLNQAWEEGALTQEEYEALFGEIATGMGIMSEDAVQAQLKIFDLNQEFAQGQMDAERYIDRVRALALELNLLPEEVVVRIRMEQEGAWGGDYGQGYQHGGRFTIQGPPGTDRSPVFFWGTRGEEVTVTPPGQYGPSTGSLSIGSIVVNVGEGADGHMIAQDIAAELGRMAEQARISGAGYVGI